MDGDRIDRYEWIIEKLVCKTHDIIINEDDLSYLLIMNIKKMNKEK